MQHRGAVSGLNMGWDNLLTVKKMFKKKTDEDDCSDPGVQCMDDSMTL